MKQVDELKAEVLKTRSELEGLSNGYIQNPENFEMMVLKSAELIEKGHELKMAFQLDSF